MDWGEFQLKKIDDSADFWCLFGELLCDASGFLHNKNTMLDAFKQGNLYGLKVNETDQMYETGARLNPIFCKDSWYLLPCFCVKENNKAILIWTHTRARNNGFAKTLVELLHIEYAYNPLPESIPFWKKCNVACLFL